MFDRFLHPRRDPGKICYMLFQDERFAGKPIAHHKFTGAKENLILSDGLGHTLPAKLAVCHLRQQCPSERV
jgi:hypothetical protein